MKNRIRILAWSYTVICGLLLAVGATLTIGLALDKTSGTAALAYIGPIFGFSCIVLVPGLIGGIGLMLGRSWGRALVMLASGFLCLLIPIGTILGALGFWVLLGNDANKLLGGGVTADVSRLKTAVSPRLTLMAFMICVGAALLLALRIAFVANHDPVPSPLDSNVLSAVAVLVLLAGISSAVFRTVRASQISAAYRRDVSDARHSVDACEGATSVNDPSTQKKLSTGQVVDENDQRFGVDMPYWETTGKIETCEHLHPIEKAMFESGIKFGLHNDKRVGTNCIIDSVELGKQFDVHPPVSYLEYQATYSGEENEVPIPTAYIKCDVHGTFIFTVHPDYGRSKSYPTFPSR